MPQKRIHYSLAGWLGSHLVRALHATWHVNVIDPATVGVGVKDGSKPAIIAFWHRHILSMMIQYRDYHVCAPVSESRDGEYVAQVMQRYGQLSVRGSTSRGSLRMLRAWAAKAREGWSPIITPDGPRGPKFSVQPGVAMLARRSDLPVYPVGLAVGNAWLAKNWDQFVIPKPWTRIAIVFNPALWADEHDGTDAFCDALREALFAATDAAQEALAQMG
ncbi:MAG: lysophospholipid acyltransferase family protein [Planctomycetota bacterium]|jgi:lysophospholipid acyltransferase (LPLAT)-like uncharacterized protein